MIDKLGYSAEFPKSLGFEKIEKTVVDLLAEEKFGILTEIDTAATFKNVVLRSIYLFYPYSNLCLLWLCPISLSQRTDQRSCRTFGIWCLYSGAWTSVG